MVKIDSLMSRHLECHQALGEAHDRIHQRGDNHRANDRRRTIRDQTKCGDRRRQVPASRKRRRKGSRIAAFAETNRHSGPHPLPEGAQSVVS